MSDPASTRRFSSFLERFSSDEVEHAIPLLVASFPAVEPELVIDPPVQAVVLEWLSRSGLSPTSTASELGAALVGSVRSTFEARAEPANGAVRSSPPTAFALRGGS